MPNHAEQLAQELNLSVKNVQGAIELIDQGNTIPFIARYRKEATGSMGDQVLRDLGDRLEVNIAGKSVNIWVEDPIERAMARMGFHRNERGIFVMA